MPRSVNRNRTIWACIFSAAPIRAVFTTGAAAYRLYQKYQAPLTGLNAYRLPSTSPANCAVSLEQLAEAYREILLYLIDNRVQKKRGRNSPLFVEFFRLLSSGLGDDLNSIPGNEELLVGGDNPDLNLGIVSGDLHLATLSVLLLVELDAEEGQIFANTLAKVAVVLADTAGESNGINAAESSSIEPMNLVIW